MIILGSTLNNFPIYSVQTSNEIARTKKAIVNPANLQIVAYEVAGPLVQNTPALMLLSDVRELSRLGFIVDDIDQLVSPEDVIKINEIYNLNFNLINKPVLDEKRNKLGKVIDFTIDTAQFLIQQLTVKRPLLKSFNDTELLIHRNQILEINNDSIIVESEAKIPEPELHEVVGSYVNPFRKTKPATEQAELEN